MKKNKVTKAFVLDHASFLGIEALRKTVPSIGFPAGYEHSVGNTDVAILGINTILPSHWTICQISNYVHMHGGFIVYLHPMKGSSLHWEELRIWTLNKYVDAWEYYNARCRHNNHSQNFSLFQVAGADLHDIEELDHFNPRLISNNDFPITIPLQGKFLERKNDITDFSFEWGNVSFKKRTDVFEIFIHMDFDFQFDKDPGGYLDENCFELALFKEEKQGWLLLYSLSYNQWNKAFYNITQDGVMKTKNLEYPMLQVTIHSRNIHVIIPEKYRHVGIAFSINRQELLPGSQRLSWPAPVWPPRSIKDTFIYE